MGFAKAALMHDVLLCAERRAARNDVQFQAGGCGIEPGRLDKRLRGVWQDSNNVGSLRAKVGCAETRRKGFNPLDQRQRADEKQIFSGLLPSLTATDLRFSFPGRKPDFIHDLIFRSGQFS
jgi:hypothetical protein